MKLNTVPCQCWSWKRKQADGGNLKYEIGFGQLIPFSLQTVLSPRGMKTITFLETPRYSKLYRNSQNQTGLVNWPTAPKVSVWNTMNIFMPNSIWINVCKAVSYSQLVLHVESDDEHYFIAMLALILALIRLTCWLLMVLHCFTKIEGMEEGAADSWRGHLWEGKGSHCERSACVNIQVNEAQWS